LYELLAVGGGDCALGPNAGAGEETGAGTCGPAPGTSGGRKTDIPEYMMRHWALIRFDMDLTFIGWTETLTIT
jgi:hypothetical protein